MASADELRLNVAGRENTDFWRQLDTLLRTSFEPDALRPIRQIRPLAPVDPHTSLAEAPRFVGIYDGGALLGFAIVEYLPSCRGLYVWYVATAVEVRGRGIGARLLQWIDEQFAALTGEVTPEPLGIFCEVEAPISAADPNDDDWRRIAFYERHGYRRMPIEDVSPPFAPGETESVMYWLLVKQPTADVELTVDDVMGFIEGSNARSTLNGPMLDVDRHLAHVRSTWGRPPRDAEAMRVAWQHSLQPRQ